MPLTLKVDPKILKILKSNTTNEAIFFVHKKYYVGISEFPNSDFENSYCRVSISPEVIKYFPDYLFQINAVGEMESSLVKSQLKSTFSLFGYLPNYGETFGSIYILCQVNHQDDPVP